MRHAFPLGSLSAAALIAHTGLAQPQEPIGATMHFEFATQCGAWQPHFIGALPGDRIEWRIVMTFTGTQAATALGRIRYQPIIINADVTGAGATIDQLGTWRNNGSNGQGNTTLVQGLLSVADGNNSCPLPNGYGRVQYAWTAMSTTPGGRGPLTAYTHVYGSELSTPYSVAGFKHSPGNAFLRISGANGTHWYPPSGTCDPAPCSTDYSVVSDNNNSLSTWFVSGTQGVVIFRQSITLSTDSGSRGLAILSEPATLQQGSTIGLSGFMTWATAGEGGINASIRTGVQFVPGIISIAFGHPPLACGSIDFNNDGSEFDPQDIDAFLSVYSEGPCVPDVATCDSIDFNIDGSLFDPCDIDSFLTMFAEGPCTPCGG